MFSARERVENVLHELADFGVWRPFTPTWTATAGSPTFGNATLTCRYAQFGKTVHASYYIVFGTTTTFAGTEWRLSLPVTAHANAVRAATGAALMFDDSAAEMFTGIAQIISTTTVGIYTEGTHAANTWASTIPMTWDDPDWVAFTLTYEAV